MKSYAQCASRTLQPWEDEDTLSPSETYVPDVGQGKRKLVLHFDVRNTVLVADSVGDLDAGQALNGFLTGVTWGHEGPEGWQWDSYMASLSAPTKGSMTYYKYLEQRMVQTPSDRAHLRRFIGDFTAAPLGQSFRQYYDTHLALLEWQHKVRDSRLMMEGPGGRLYHYILPSFFRLVQHLQDTHRDFAIVFRTYGLDVPNVLNCLDYTLHGHHPGFRMLLPMEVNPTPGKVIRRGDMVTFEVPSPHREHSNGFVKTTNIYSTERSIYSMLSDSQGICAFVDDFSHWQNHGYHRHAGKPFWVDPTDTKVQHIFFDDNIRVTEADSIVDMRVLGTSGGGGGGRVLAEDVAGFEDVCLVQADLLQSLQNEAYFVDKLATCEANYSRLLASLQLTAMKTEGSTWCPRVTAHTIGHVTLAAIALALSWSQVSARHWGRDKMAAIFQTTFPNAFSWMKIYQYRLKFIEICFYGFI